MFKRIKKYKELTEQLIFARTMKEMVDSLLHEKEEEAILNEMDMLWKQMNLLELLYVEAFVVPKLCN